MINRILILEERITCGKIKSNVKTLLFGQLNGDGFDENDDNKINTFKLLNVVVEFNNLNNINFIKSLLADTIIIISTEPNPKSSNSHILVFPGYLMDIKKISLYELELDIFFNNFFPHNIPINKNKLYFMIWFGKQIKTNTIIKTSINYKFDELKLNDSNTISLESNEMEINKKIIKYLLIQQTQTFNVICNTKAINKIMKICKFRNMCRGFWIKMLNLDYDNLKLIILSLNGYNRLELTQYQIELMGIKKYISNNYILIFMNLELDKIEWKMPTSREDVNIIYLNSLNCSRIDTVKFIFEFTGNFINSDIKITSLSLNFLNSKNNTLKYKYF